MRLPPALPGSYGSLFNCPKNLITVSPIVQKVIHMQTSIPNLFLLIFLLFRSCYPSPCPSRSCPSSKSSPPPKCERPRPRPQHNGTRPLPPTPPPRSKRTSFPRPLFCLRCNPSGCPPGTSTPHSDLRGDCRSKSNLPRKRSRTQGERKWFRV
jgi:hypothetical protein